MRCVLGLAPTGWPEECAIGNAVPEVISLKMWGKPDWSREAREVVWEADAVTVTRHWQDATRDRFEAPVYLWRSGGVSLGFAGGRYKDDPAESNQIGAWFREQLARGRDILLELGGHGDLRVVYAVDLTNGLSADAKFQKGAVGVVRPERWTSLDADDERDEALCASIIDDFRRAVGFPPIR
jgi:hypothetical protein